MTTDQRTIANVSIELVSGDITRQEDADAVVNAANAELMIGGGVAGAIHRAAGPELANECRPLAPIRPGECVITGAHRLPNRYVLHCLGPIHGVDEPAPDLLARCYREALELADQHGLGSVAFPAISTGAFGYPMRAAADVAIPTVAGLAPHLASVGQVRFVLQGAPAMSAHRDALSALPA